VASDTFEEDGKMSVKVLLQRDVLSACECSITDHIYISLLLFSLLKAFSLFYTMSQNLAAPTSRGNDICICLETFCIPVHAAFSCLLEDIMLTTT